LEEIRRLDTPPPLVFTSTNKVYGSLEDVSLSIQDGRYEPENPLVRMRGIGEDRPLDFHSPYGCSKGTADQYVLDYARCFRLPATVFRMGCVYGPHQFGTEDQGWVAHFMIRALENRPLTIYGDGSQTRSFCYATDEVDGIYKLFMSGDHNPTNVGNPDEYTVKQLAELVVELTGTKSLSARVLRP
jgi:CDP-paratose 2-epimerase